MTTLLNSDNKRSRQGSGIDKKKSEKQLTNKTAFSTGFMLETATAAAEVAPAELPAVAQTRTGMLEVSTFSASSNYTHKARTRSFDFLLLI